MNYKHSHPFDRSAVKFANPPFCFAATPFPTYKSSAGMRWAVFHPCLISPELSKIGREIEKTLRADGVLFLFLSHALSRTVFHLPNLRLGTSLSRILFHPLPRWSEVRQNNTLCRTLPILSLTASLVISFLQSVSSPFSFFLPDLDQDSWSENPWQWPLHRTISSYDNPLHRVTDILVVELHNNISLLANEELEGHTVSALKEREFLSSESFNKPALS
ncbi:hypothetical protein ACLOJK_037123 [Asimina triloba]